jgi:DNA modification methylase
VGRWEDALPAKTAKPTRAYGTKFGRADYGDGAATLAAMRAGSARLVLTSPPFALTRKKKYGNRASEDYIDWFMPYARAVHRVMRADGSFVLDLGGSWEPGRPIKNVYQYELLLALLRDKAAPFVLAQEFYWLNRARLPGPIEWVNIKRIRVTDAVNVVWWLSKTDSPYADNRQVLRPYSPSMLRLFNNGYNSGPRPSEWHIGATSFSTNNGGSIPNNYLGADGEAELGYPTNLLAGSNTSSHDPYLTACRDLGLRPNPARFPAEFADFFVKFLTKKQDLVVDPFAGSNTTGSSAERLGRRWRSVEIDPVFVAGSAARFAKDPARVLRRLGATLSIPGQGPDSESRWRSERPALR